MISTWSLIHLASKSRVKLIKMRKQRVMMKQCKNYCIISSKILKELPFLLEVLQIVAFFPDGMTEMSLAVR